MHSHDGTWSFLKLFSTFVFVGVAVWWLQGVLGGDYTVLIVFALVGVILFAGGALYGHANQKMTLDAITRFNANDAKIDRYRLETMKESQKGQTAWDKAHATMTVLEAKRLDKAVDQRAKLMIGERSQQQGPVDTWTYDDDDNDNFQEWQ